jgi:hypothetical protein
LYLLFYIGVNIGPGLDWSCLGTQTKNRPVWEQGTGENRSVCEERSPRRRGLLRNRESRRTGLLKE